MLLGAAQRKGPCLKPAARSPSLRTAAFWRAGAPRRAAHDATQCDQVRPCATKRGPLRAAALAGMPALRRALVARAAGDVLELAVGTGINLPLYTFGAGHVTSLTGG